MPARWLRMDRTTCATIALVVVGLSLRSYHYFRQPPVWHDEATVLVNVIQNNYTKLLGPLLLDATGPPLFLWLERTAYLTLGDNPLALRLLPFLASCAALLLMAYLARQLLSTSAAPWAVLLFACSEQLLWHACEAKPYAVDVFVAAFLTTAACLLRPRPLGQQLLALTLLAPPTLLVSFPAVFVFGGLLTAYGLAVWKDGRPASWLALLLLTAVVGCCFGWVLLVPGRAQQTPAMVSTWTHCFPDWEHPGTVLGWIILSALEVCRYCCKPIGQTLAGLLVIGVFRLWRAGRRDLTLVLGVPILLALLAALTHRYPFGGVRVMAYAAPAVILFVAAGIPPTFAWLSTHFRAGIVVVVVLLLFPAGEAAYGVLFPWPVADPASAAEYVEAHRLSTDRVVGNDWTHLYYFRHLGARFLPAGNVVSPEPDGRVWVVVTTGKDESPEERLRLAAGMAPAGWTLRPEAEFRFTSVVLGSRP